LGEVRREPTFHVYISGSGKRCVTRAFKLFAEKREAAYVEVHPTRSKSGTQPPKVGPNGGRINTRYDDPNARPLPNQGGQGSIGIMPRGVNVMLGE
jgi:hypothetical protein